MLVLTRRLSESVVVGDDGGIECLLKVTVLAIRGGSVRLGFEIAERFPVHRWEIWQQLHGSVRSTLPERGSPAPAAGASVPAA